MTKEHVLFTDKDEDAPNGIKDRNGQVCLSVCKVCFAGEIELDQFTCEEYLAIGADEQTDTPDSVDFGAPRVRFKWATPDGDNMVAHMARVSNPKAKEDDPAERLIGYLLKNHHWSPFEMVNLCLEVHTERDISAQILRHWTLKFQEFSTRYAEVEDLRWSTECRFQDAKNRQSSATIEERLASYDEETPGGMSAANYDSDTVSYFDALVNETRTRSLEGYRELLSRGVAKECARRLLPIGLMPTVMYINGNLRSWITYCMERTKPGVQKEHREIALAVEPFIAEHYPLIWAAVLQYRAIQEDRDRRVTEHKGIEALLDETEPRWRDQWENVGAVVRDLIKERMEG